NEERLLFRNVLFARAIFLGIAATAAVPARLAAAAVAGAPPVASIALTPAPREPVEGDVLSGAAIARQEHAAAAAAAAQQPPSIQDMIRGAFQPLGDGAVNGALKIARCESKYDPNAVNGASDAQGLFQFLPSTWRGTPFAAGSPFDPATNAKAAAWLYQTYGPTQWECVA
ncbi:MAG: transglycosylase SLT domain-containing protein, partial [Chloroflexota bacterium]